MMDRQSEVAADMPVLTLVRALFPIDFLADGCILLSVQLALSRFHIKRLARALLLCMLAGFLCCLLGFPPAAAQLLLCPAASLLLLGRQRIRRVAEGAAAIFCTYAAAGGLALLVGRRWVGILLGLALFTLLLCRRRHARYQWNIEVSVEKNASQAVFPALIDTGNRLREHRSGLPVLIVEEQLLKNILPEIDPAELRFLPYGVLGASGEIPCFQPDRVALRFDGGRFRPAPSCYVAMYAGRLPGKICALAPPEFAEYAQCSTVSTEINNTLRRFYHGVFKRKAIHLRSGCADPAGLGVLHRRQRSASPAPEPR